MSQTDTFGAGAFLTGKVRVLPGESPIPRDSVHPDNDTTIWPIPHDPKIDTIEVLRAVLRGPLGLDDDMVGISKDGAFSANALKNAKGHSIPYIVVTRVRDEEQRYGIGKHFGTYTEADRDKPDGRFIDDKHLVREGSVMTVRGSYSMCTIAVDIFDVNGYRADQMYLIVKYILEAALEQYEQIGYVKFRRINGEDSVKLAEDGGGAYPIFNRTLTYEAMYPMFVETIENAVNLVRQTLILDELHPNADEPEYTVL